MSIVIEIKVVPASGMNKWVFDKNGTLKCYLKNSPERNLANNELVKLIAQAQGVSRDMITIIMGATSRKKTVKIDALVSYEECIKNFGLSLPEHQESFIQKEE